MKLCELYSDHVSAIAKGARVGIVECQHQFKNSQWNCSTVSNETVFGPSITNIATRESAFVHAISSAGVLQAVARSCRNGDLSSCGCSTSKRPANLNKDWVWGGCGDNVEYGYKFAKNFVDIAEKSLVDDKQIIQQKQQRFLNRFRKSNGKYFNLRDTDENESMNSIDMRRAKARRLMNVHNYEAGRRVSLLIIINLKL